MPVRRLPQLLAALLLLATAGCAFFDFEPVLPDDAVQSHRGVWIGKSYQDTVGSVSVHRAEDDALILIEENFSIPRASNVIVALGRDGYQPAAVVGTLRRPVGRQVFRIPEELRNTGYNEIWLWDSMFNRPVGLARLRAI